MKNLNDDSMTMEDHVADAEAYFWAYRVVKKIVTFIIFVTLLIAYIF